jgi:hypothetical protein
MGQIEKAGVDPKRKPFTKSLTTSTK